MLICRVASGPDDGPDREAGWGSQVERDCKSRLPDRGAESTGDDRKHGNESDHYWVHERHGGKVARWTIGVMAWLPGSLFGMVLCSEETLQPESLLLPNSYKELEPSEF
jgi:hypothetical protein